MKLFSKDILYKKNVRLPSAYQEVEWIKCSGTQWINTDIYFSYPMSFIADCDKDSTDTDVCLLGSLLYGQGNTYARICAYHNGPNGWFMNAGSATLFSGKRTDNCYMYGYIDSNKYAFCNINGTTYSTISSQIDTSNNPIMGLFGIRYENEGIGWLGKFTFRSLKLFSDASYSTPVADFVPCYRKSDGEIGVYDTVRGRFFTNDGTGTFTKGGDV